MVTRNELKKALISEGFEVYRTLPDRIVLAERVRDNLIMDSGVAAGFGDRLSVRFVVRAQGSDFAGEDEQTLFERAEALASGMKDIDYREVGRGVVPVHDPGDKARILDTWFEVAFEKHVPTLEVLLVEVRRVMAIQKTAAPSRQR